MKKRAIPELVVLLSAFVTLSAGCKSVNTVETAEPVAQRQYINDKRVVTDPSLGRRVKVLGVNAATGPGGFLKIQIEVQNTTRRSHAFTYRVEWFDENGIIFNTPMGVATPRTLEGRETASIVATAPIDRAKDFRIKFLEPIR